VPLWRSDKRGLCLKQEKGGVNAQGARGEAAKGLKFREDLMKVALANKVSEDETPR